ncbi:hypothetical protein ACFL5L_05320 [candidate division KSB1 bacterium]
MAIGEVQNRFNTGGQEFTRPAALDQDRTQQNQVQNREAQPVVQPESTNRNAAPRPLGPNPQQVVQQPENRNPANRVQNPEKAGIGGVGVNPVIQRREEAVLLNTQTQNTVPEANLTGNTNAEERGVERIEQAQIRQINQANAAAANTRQQGQAGNTGPTQENQLGSRLDILG